MLQLQLQLSQCSWHQSDPDHGDNENVQADGHQATIARLRDEHGAMNTISAGLMTCSIALTGNTTKLICKLGSS